MSANAEISAELLFAMREIVRNAIMTLSSLRDPDRKYLGLAQMPVNVVHDVQDAYGYTSTWVRRFIPSARELDQMDIVMPWIAWVRREHGEHDCKRLIAWAMGAPLWSLADREDCTNRTILNRIDRSIVAIILKFTGANIPVERIEEPYAKTKYAMIWEKPVGPHGEVRIKKVYVGGMGFMKNGRKVRDGREKFDLKALAS